MAVFVRSKRRFLPELSRALERRRVPHDKPDARLVDHPAVRTLFDCVLAATSTGGDRDRAVRRILLGQLFELPLGKMRDLERLRLSSSWPDVIRSSVNGGSRLAELLEDPTWATETSAIDGFWEVWTGLPQMTPVAAEPTRSEERAALTSLAQVLSRLAERDPSMSLDTYRKMAGAEDFEATPLLSYRIPDEDRLTLTTLHQSKGLQFDFVFIADAVEGTFPDLRPRESLLGSRHLNESLPEDTPGYLRFRLQEEMRLAYTAMSRARRRVVWTCTSRGFDEGRGMPSRFLPSVAGVDTVEAALDRPSADITPVTPLESEAWLRRIAGDPTETSVRRAAAVSLLIEGPTWGMRPWRRFAGTAPRGPDTGLVGASLTMSPSRAEAYLACPRRFAFERLLRVGGEPSNYATLGLVVHGVLERVERAAMERGEAHGTLDEAIDHLGDSWDPDQFGGPPWADSWKRRAEFILERLYTLWPGSGAAVALEQHLALQFEGVEWKGRADRIEQRGDRLVVVDYKTGATPLSFDEAAASLQLGFYSLAVAEAFQQEDVDAEMWYPAKKGQKSIPVRSLDTHRIGDIENAMRVATIGIQLEEWMPLPSPSCERCAVRLVCPEWPEGQEAFSQ
jgi:ATP-dependent exoDNAse (exonuclease V) beta subunit